MLPIVTLPKFMDPGVTPSVPLVVVPLPVRGTLTSELEALELREMFAEIVPAAVGLKVTVKGTLCPAAIVSGNVRPPKVKAELLELAEDKVTLPPLAVRFPF